jgi:hypothetical protein
MILKLRDKEVIFMFLFEVWILYDVVAHDVQVVDAVDCGWSGPCGGCEPRG